MIHVSEDCDVYAKWGSATYITITIDQSYLNKAPLIYTAALDMTGNAKITLPIVDNKGSIYDSVFGCTYGFSDKKQTGEFGTIKYFGGTECKFTKDTTLYRVLNEYGGGSGTEADPYIISSYDQLLRLAEQGAKGCFIQTADIKFPNSVDRKPINTVTISKGYENKSYNFFVYDGQGYSIKNLSGSGGLFGTIAASTIKNIVVDGANINSQGYNNVGAICNDVVSYAYPSSSGNGYFATGNSRIINCTVKNSKISGNGADNIGGICGYGGAIADSFASGVSISGGDCVGGIVGNACSVTGCLANNITVTDSVDSSGGIAGTAYGVILYDKSNNSYSSGGSIIGCGVRTFVASATNSGGIVGTATSDTNFAYIKSCYAANIFLSGENNGGIIGADGNNGYAHRITYCLVDNANNYPVIGGDDVRSVAKVMVLSVPADTGLTVDGVLSVLNAASSGYSYWTRSDGENGGYPYPQKIGALK